MDEVPATAAAQAKAELREALRRSRALLDEDALRVNARAVAETLLAEPRVEQSACVAVYTSFGSEPSTRAIRAALRVRGVLVLRPYLLEDGDLDWVDDDRTLMAAPDPSTGREAAVHPDGPRLGPEAIGRADVVIVPALAVDRDGVRLGQGGGSYDRALTRSPQTALKVALLHDGELLTAGSIARQPHDVIVDAVVTPTVGFLRLPA